MQGMGTDGILIRRLSTHSFLAASCRTPRWESNPQARGSRPRRYANLRTRSWRVRGSHPAVQAYEARMSTGPPAVAGPGIEPGGPVLWEPVGHLPRLQSSVTKGRLELPCLAARRSDRRVSTSSTTWSSSSPCGNRTRLTRSRVWYPMPIDERAVLSVRRAGVEPA